MYIVVLFVLLDSASPAAVRFNNQEFRGATQELARKRCVRAATLLDLTFNRVKWACVAKDFDDE